MEENQSMVVFQSYNDAFKTWSEAVSSWTEGMSDIFKSQGGNGNGFRFWGYMGDWVMTEARLAEMVKNISVPYETVKMDESLTKTMDSYQKICDTCLRNMVSIYDLNMKSITEEETGTDKFFETLWNAYNNMSATVVEVSKDTPFEKIKEIDDAVKESLDAFSDERTMARGLFKELVEFSKKIAGLSVSAASESLNVLTDVKEAGTISSDAYKDMLDVYGETLKRSLEIVDIPEPLLPEIKDAVDETVSLSAKNLDVFNCWMEINLKLGQAVGKFAEEFKTFAEDTLKKDEIPAQEDILESWSKTYGRALRILIEGTHFNGSVPKFMDICTDYMKSVSEYSRYMMLLPYTAKTEAIVEQKTVAESEKV